MSSTAPTVLLDYSTPASHLCECVWCVRTHPLSSVLGYAALLFVLGRARMLVACDVSFATLHVVPTHSRTLPTRTHLPAPCTADDIHRSAQVRWNPKNGPMTAIGISIAAGMMA
jgi:hypothetical protein